MPDHRYALSAEVHEPKHITNTDTNDAGKVITPSSVTSGVSVIRNLTPEEVGVVISYGEFDTDNNNSSFSMTAAVDPSLQDESDYINVMPAIAPTTPGETFGVTYDGANNTLEVETTGVYRVGGWFNINTDTANSKVAVRYTLDGTPSGGKLVTDIKAADRTQNLSGFGIITLTAGDKIGISIACDKSADLIIEDMRLNLELIRAF